MGMTRFAVFFALCVLPAIVIAKPFELTGKTYCDICRAGFETDGCQYLPGTIVKLECKSRENEQKVTYSKTAVTDSTGTYKFTVDRDFGEDVCDVMLVKSAFSECSSPNAGRDRARVILTNKNGMTSNERFANSLGFLRNVPLASCTQILQKYQDSEDV